MSERMVDRNAMRGGAAVSAIILVVAFLIDIAALAALVCVALGIGSIFGPKAGPLGSAYRALKRAFRLNIPLEPEPEAPPRFAQTLGFVVTAVGVVLVMADASAAGWGLILLVAALQALLAVTGICIGCEMYLIGKRLSARGA